MSHHYFPLVGLTRSLTKVVNSVDEHPPDDLVKDLQLGTAGSHGTFHVFMVLTLCIQAALTDCECPDSKACSGEGGEGGERGQMTVSK